MKKSQFHAEEDNYEEMFKEIKAYVNIEDENYRDDPKYIRLLEALSKKR
jgi:hypothetical protein